MPRNQDEQVEEQLGELLQLLRDVRFLLWVGQRREIQELVADAFEDDAQRAAFRLLSKGQSYREIGREVGASHTTVGTWVTKWREMGLVSPKDTQPLVDPETLGI